MKEGATTIPMADTATPAGKRITPADILPGAEYAARRVQLRREIVDLKRRRRLEVGPSATLYFECHATMLQQVQEMLHIEKGGAEQLPAELAAYNPLIPQGCELVATVMFEIDDPIRRERFLARIGGVEHTLFIQMGDEKIMGQAEEDQNRTNESGKASAVQFVRFAFTPREIAIFRAGNVPAIVGLSHENYAHMAVMPEAVREELAGDFD